VKKSRRAYSICSVRQRGIAHCSKERKTVLSPQFANYTKPLKAGDVLEVGKPEGKFTSLNLKLADKNQCRFCCRKESHRYFHLKMVLKMSLKVLCIGLMKIKHQKKLSFTTTRFTL
jgi:ferredoxin-NADP reductase